MKKSEIPLPQEDLDLFDEWNKEKKDIHMGGLIQEAIFINPRDVWYIKMGINTGNEQNGKGEFHRPVLVIRKIGNMFFCVPLTTKGKNKNLFYHSLDTSFEGKRSWIIVSQARTYDKKRFMELLGKITPEEFHIIKKSLKKMYFGEI